MTFEEWYKKRNPDLRPEDDDMFEELRDCFEAGQRSILDYLAEEGQRFDKDP